MILAIDPGTTESAYVVWDGGRVVECDILPNGRLLELLQTPDRFDGVTSAAVEMIACYGMAVGRETFETCVWIGRFIERMPFEAKPIFRKDVKLHICGSMRAKDPNIRQALIDRYGKPGTKKNPGQLYGCRSHVWAALAVAVTASETSVECTF